MSNRLKIWLVLITMVIMAVMVILLAPGAEDSSSKVEKKSFVSDDWDEKFAKDSKKPLGLYLFQELLTSSLAKGGKVHTVASWNQIDSLNSVKNEAQTFLFIGEVFALNYDETTQLKNNIEQGGKLFLSCENTNSTVNTIFFKGLESSFEYNESVEVYTTSEKFKMSNVYQEDTVAEAWGVFDRGSLYDSTTELSTIMEQPNFIHYKLGKGEIFIHLNPNMFFNNQMKEKDGFNHFAFVMESFQPKGDVLFLELAQASWDDSSDSNSSPDDSGSNEDDSYLKYLFETTQGKIAVLLAIFAVLLFVIFRSKRMRPIVPYLPSQKDMSLAFAETITSIYIAKKNPYGILQVMRRNFYDTVQKHFFIDLTKRDSDRPLISLSEKSNVPLGDIKRLISSLEAPNSVNYSQKKIHEIQQSQHEFYRLTGIISDSLIELIKRKEFHITRSFLFSTLMIAFGVLFIIAGLFLLTQGDGLGILFWPIGILILTFGILRLSIPLLKIKGDSIIHSSLLGLRKTYLKEDLLSVKINTANLILRFTNNRTLTINLWDLGSSDKSQLMRLISSLEK